jgi:peroxiredoxin (alkyl hydroperoxide reductase subunit C)
MAALVEGEVVMSGRGFNWQIWAGLLLAAAAFISYPLLFVKWPATRDVPWVNVLLTVVAAVLLFAGTRRAFSPGRFRIARILVAAIVVVASATLLLQFFVGIFVTARDLPLSARAPQVGQQAPAFALPDESGTSRSLTDLLSTPAASTAQRPKAVLLIFYMYSGCRACNSEFRGIQQNLAQLSQMGIRPVAISIDPPDVSRRLSQEAGYTFTFLSDPAMEVIRRYDVAHGDHGARPAEFLVDAAGTVRWRNLTSNMFVRPRAEQIIEAARALQ